MSAYFQQLNPEDRLLYGDKIRVIGVDPYVISRHKTKALLECRLEELPETEYPDIYNYLVNKPGRNFSFIVFMLEQGEFLLQYYWFSLQVMMEQLCVHIKVLRHTDTLSQAGLGRLLLAAMMVSLFSILR